MPDTRICDFCGSDQIAWAYPCAAFTSYLYGERFEDAWLACEPCAAIIEVVPEPLIDNAEAGAVLARLGLRSMAGVGIEQGSTSTERWLAMGAYLLDIHIGFLLHRQGPRQGYP